MAVEIKRRLPAEFEISVVDQGTTRTMSVAGEIDIATCPIVMSSGSCETSTRQRARPIGMSRPMRSRRPQAAARAAAPTTPTTAPARIRAASTPGISSRRG